MGFAQTAFETMPGGTRITSYEKETDDGRLLLTVIANREGVASSVILLPAAKKAKEAPPAPPEPEVAAVPEPEPEPEKPKAPAKKKKGRGGKK